MAAAEPSADNMILMGRRAAYGSIWQANFEARIQTYSMHVSLHPVSRVPSLTTCLQHFATMAGTSLGELGGGGGIGASTELHSSNYEDVCMLGFPWFHSLSYFDHL